jgi:uncharacterized MnhB-related membrane protein
MQITRKVAVKYSALAALVAASVSSAMAAVDAGVTTAIETAKTDVATIGAAVFLVIIAIAVYKWFRRAV